MTIPGLSSWWFGNRGTWVRGYWVVCLGAVRLSVPGAYASALRKSRILSNYQFVCILLLLDLIPILTPTSAQADCSVVGSPLPTAPAWVL